MTEVGREKKIRYIMLALIKGLGPVSLNVLLDMCGSIENCFGMDEDELRTHRIWGQTPIENIKNITKILQCL